MTRTFLTMASGRHVDLLNPRARDIDLDDVAENLAKENRYNGATPGTAYSVAQHLCLGADAIFAEMAEPKYPAHFLLHDFPEYALKDDTTPKKRALAELAEAEFGVLGKTIMAAFDRLTERWDIACHEAAGLPWPVPAAIARAVHRYDQIMLVTEWRDLKRCPMPFTVDAGIEPLAETVTPWPWQRAKAELMHRCEFWLPAHGAGP